MWYYNCWSSESPDLHGRVAALNVFKQTKVCDIKTSFDPFMALSLKKLLLLRQTLEENWHVEGHILFPSWMFGTDWCSFFHWCSTQGQRWQEMNIFFLTVENAPYSNICQVSQANMAWKIWSAHHAKTSYTWNLQTYTGKLVSGILQKKTRKTYSP